MTVAEDTTTRTPESVERGRLIGVGKTRMTKMREEIRERALKHGIQSRKSPTPMQPSAPSLEFKTRGVRIWPKVLALSARFQIDRKLTEAQAYSAQVWDEEAYPVIFLKRDNTEDWVVVMRTNEFFRLVKLADAESVRLKVESQIPSVGESDVD